MKRKANEIATRWFHWALSALWVWVAVTSARAQTVSFDPLIAIRPTDRIVVPIDDSRTVRRFGNVYPKLKPQFDRGRVAPESRMEHIFLLLRSDPNQLAALDRLNAAQKDPHSPLYHHWLEPATFGLHFGTSERDLAAITGWLQSKGFHVEPASPGRRNLEFSGTVAQVEAAFHTEIHWYLIDGELHIANATDPEIPEALESVVEGPAPLHDFAPRALNVPSPTYLSTSYGNTIGPADFATIYDLNPLYNDGLDGTGESIAILAQSNINIEDIQSFMQTFKPGADVNLQVLLAGADPGIQCPNGQYGSGCDWVEATLDVERAMSVAPGAEIKLVVGPNLQPTCSFFGLICSSTSISVGDISAPASQLMIAGLNAVENKVAPIISVSYGLCELGLLNNGTGGLNNELNWWYTLWQEADSYGISVFVASGDNGAAMCLSGGSPVGPAAVNGICSSPTVTCVGGTEFDDYETPISYWSSSGIAETYIPESVWNVSAASGCSNEPLLPANPTPNASGGGISAYWDKPSYQDALTPVDGHRDVPDVSLAADNAHDPYVYVINGAVSAIGGTSAAAPSMAGIMAILMQNIGQPLWGNFAPWLYATAPGTDSYTNPFHATRCGNNSVPGISGYSASPPVPPSVESYNLATGLGSVDAALLAETFDGTYKPKLTATVDQTSINMAVGSTAQFTLKVAAIGGFNSAVTICSFSVPPGLSILTPLNPSTISLPAPGGGSITFTFTTTSAASAGYSALIAMAVCGQGWQVGASVTVNFAGCGFKVSPSTIPEPWVAGTAGLAIDAPVGCNWTASANPDWVTLLSPASGSGTAQLIFSYAANPTGFSRLGGVTVQGQVNGSLSEILGTTVDQAAAPSVTIQTSPPGLQISVGGVTGNTPYIWTCTGGSISVSVPSPQSGSPGVQFMYSSWSDGASQTRTIACPGTSATSYTANFAAQYYLTMTAGNGGTVSPASGWYNAHDGVAISASPGAGYAFSSWTGAGTESYSGTNSNSTVSMSGPIGESASFKIKPTVMLTPSLSIITTAQALPVTVTVNGGSGSPTPPAGTVILTSGTYSSSATTLAGGSTTITVPAGSLAVGSDTLTATYSGDGNYSRAAGTATVTVNQAQGFSLSASPATLTVAQGASGTGTITVTSVGGFSGNVSLAAVGLPNGVTASFAPGSVVGTQLLTLTVNATAAVTSSPVTIGITGTSGALSATTAVALTVTGVTAGSGSLSITPASFAFAGTIVGSESAVKQFIVKNTGTTPVTFSGFTYMGSNASSFVQTDITCGGTLTAGSACAIAVAFKPQSAGALTATLNMADSAVGSPQTVALSGTGVAAGTGSLTVTPASFAFAATSVGSESAIKQFVVKNTGTTPVTFSSFTYMGSNASSFVQTDITCAGTLAAGSACAIAIAFKPQTAGSLSAILNIADSAAGSPQTVALSGTGVASGTPGTLTFTPASLSLTFAATSVGSQSAVQQVIVKNAGSIPVTFSGFTYTGANASSFVQTDITCGSSLAAGSACAVAIAFKPQSSGALSATLNIADSASGSPQKFALAGTGK